MRRSEDEPRNELGDYDEPPIEAFEEDEEPLPSSKRRRWIVKVIAALIAFAMIFQVGSFFLEHFNLNALQFLSESNELTEDGSFAELEEAVVAVQTGTGHGTGFSITKEGQILTNEHVVRDALEIIVSFSDGDLYYAEVVKVERESDLALLKLIDTEGRSFPSLSIASAPAEPGDSVFVMGHPLTHSYIINEGVVKESTRAYQVVDITNAVYPGHSGSPVLSTQQEVVGVVYARQAGGDESGQGLAVPLHVVNTFLNQ
ncbi:serine protease precursor MucD/AlgY associated with sigma factor RpoE [Bacillus sp. JCM 19045]|nr:serine protease precursor MucD/AlgY associated with sigma factor RpoE [Bacillus sp. JCM 19045]